MACGKTGAYDEHSEHDVPQEYVCNATVRILFIRRTPTRARGAGQAGSDGSMADEMALRKKREKAFITGFGCNCFQIGSNKKSVAGAMDYLLLSQFNQNLSSHSQYLLRPNQMQ